MAFKQVLLALFFTFAFFVRSTSPSSTQKSSFLSDVGSIFRSFDIVDSSQASADDVAVQSELDKFRTFVGDQFAGFKGQLKNAWTAWKGQRAGVEPPRFEEPAADLGGVLGTVMTGLDDTRHQLTDQLQRVRTAIQGYRLPTDPVFKGISDVEERIMQEMKSIKERFSKVFARLMEQPQDSKHHRHQAVFRCAECGHQIPFHELLHLADPDTDLSTVEEDFWTDVEVTEYFEGWAEYVRERRVPCPQCGSSNWVEVVTWDKDEL